MTEQAINLFEKGALVNLKIGSWSGRKMLTQEDMHKLGIDTSNLPDDVVNYGRKLLVSKGELQTMTKIEQRARNYLAQWSFSFGISNSHFVPVNMLPSVEKQLAEFQKEYEAAVNSFVSRFEELKKDVQQRHPVFWERCLKDCYPKNPQSLRSRFRFKWFVFRVTGIGFEETDVHDLLIQEKVNHEKRTELRERMQSEVNDFVEEYVRAMRAETIRFCDLVKARLSGKPFEDEEKPKELTPRSLAMFKKYVDRFKNMNIFGDQEIEQMLSEFRDVFMDPQTTAKDITNSDVIGPMLKSLDDIRQKAADQGEETSNFINQLKRKVVI